MNHCRTCKHWSVTPGLIGFGACVNFNAQLLTLAKDGFRTAQSFGCVLHEQGPCEVEIICRQDQMQEVEAFLNERFPEMNSTCQSPQTGVKPPTEP